MGWDVDRCRGTPSKDRGVLSIVRGVGYTHWRISVSQNSHMICPTQSLEFNRNDRTKKNNHKSKSQKVKLWIISLQRYSQNIKNFKMVNLKIGQWCQTIRASSPCCNYVAGVLCQPLSLLATGPPKCGQLLPLLHSCSFAR